METFSERLRIACQIAGIEWGQTALAQALGVAKQTADRWMGTTVPKADQLFAIADKLKVDARWLATGQGEMRLAANEPAAAQYEVVRQRTHSKVVREVRPKAEHSAPRNSLRPDKPVRKS